MKIDQKDKKQDWKDEFEEKFVGYDENNCFGLTSRYIEEDNPERIIAFISQLLAVQEEELKVKVFAKKWLFIGAVIGFQHDVKALENLVNGFLKDLLHDEK